MFEFGPENKIMLERVQNTRRVPVIFTIQSQLFTHITDSDTGKRLQRVDVAHGHDEGVQPVTGAVGRVELRVDGGVRGALAQVAHPDLCRLDVRRVDDELLQSR